MNKYKLRTLTLKEDTNLTVELVNKETVDLGKPLNLNYKQIEQSYQRTTTDKGYPIKVKLTTGGAGRPFWEVEFNEVDINFAIAELEAAKIREQAAKDIEEEKAMVEEPTSGVAVAATVLEEKNTEVATGN